MNANYKKFYRNFYLKTGGFLPAKPLNQNIYPGDFFQIQNGEMILLGNIFRSQIVDPGVCRFDYGARLNPFAWTSQSGVTRPYTGREKRFDTLGGESEYHKQVISFADFGDFLFKGSEPESVKIINWSDIQLQLIIKLTQTYYSFREVYVVTESASCMDWTLAISGGINAELEIITDEEGAALMDVFGQPGASTLLAKDLEYYHRESKRKPVFFKAKKLIVQDEKLSIFMSELTGSRQLQQEWARGFYQYEFHYDEDYVPEIQHQAQTSLLDMLRTSELNPNTALQYFAWREANLDDIEKLFTPYGN